MTDFRKLEQSFSDGLVPFPLLVHLPFEDPMKRSPYQHSYQHLSVAFSFANLGLPISRFILGVSREAPPLWQISCHCSVTIPTDTARHRFNQNYASRRYDQTVVGS